MARMLIGFVVALGAAVLLAAPVTAASKGNAGKAGRIHIVAVNKGPASARGVTTGRADRGVTRVDRGAANGRRGAATNPNAGGRGKGAGNANRGGNGAGNAGRGGRRPRQGGGQPGGKGAGRRWR